MKLPQKILEDLGHHPSKRWGQNFLIQPNSVRQIIDWANAKLDEKILEIGPGLGAMTGELLHRGYAVTCVEIDPNLCTHLEDELGGNGNFRLISKNFLEIDWKTELLGENYFVLANLPYSVTTPILEELIKNRTQLQGASLLLQEEVVERIVALPSDRNYGRLSVFLQNFFSCQSGPRISKNSFFPKPDIESRLLRLEKKTPPEIPEEMEKEFFDLSRILFSHQRKTLRKILLQHFGGEGLAAIEILEMDTQRRPATLTIGDIRAITKALTSLK